MTAFDQVMDEVNRRANKQQPLLIARCVERLTAARVHYVNKIVGRASGDLGLVRSSLSEDREYAVKLAEYIKAKKLLGYRTRQREFLSDLVQNDKDLMVLTNQLNELAVQIRNLRAQKNQVTGLGGSPDSVYRTQWRGNFQRVWGLGQ